MTPAEGEAQGGGRGPLIGSPLTPHTLHPHLLLERSAKLVDFLAKILFYRGNYFVFVYDCSN